MLNLVVGPSGCGKTHFIKELLRNSREPFILSSIYGEEYKEISENVVLHKVNSFSQVKKGINLEEEREIIFSTNNSSNIKLVFPYLLRKLSNEEDLFRYTLVFEESFFYITQNIFNYLLRLSRMVDIYIITHTTYDFECFLDNLTISQINIITSKKALSEKNTSKFLLTNFGIKINRFIEYNDYDWFKINIDSFEKIHLGEKNAS